MYPGIKVYNIKSFIRKNESGVLTRERIFEIIREIGVLATCLPEKDILLDFRETKLNEDIDMTDAMKFVIEANYFKEVLTNKIACLLPADHARLEKAEKVRVLMQIKGIKYRYFTNFEHAIEWLSSSRV